MKSLAALLFVCSIVLADAPQRNRPPKMLPLDRLPGVTLKNRTNSQCLPDRVIVKLMPRVTTSLSKSTFGISSIDRVLTHAAGIRTERAFPSALRVDSPTGVDLSLFYIVQFSSPNDPFALAEELSKLAEVQYAEPSFIYPLAGSNFTPNDPLFLPYQWGLQKINAPAAWDYSQGDSAIVIGIVDSGVDWAHPDLAANIWTNQREIPGNGIDDDNNGFIDDIHGWDFAGADWRNPSEDNNPTPTGDNNNHGTHVAGIAAAVTDNGKGVASIAFKCRVLPVKCASDDDARSNGLGYIVDGYRGIAYAANMGAKIINCSWGGEGGSQFEQDVVDYATGRGALVVGSAGNSGSDGFFSPAGYRGVLGVAATDQSDAKPIFSNYGDYIDVCAPGVNIWSTVFPTSTYPDGYASFDGTSMSSPLAAGVAALVTWKFPQLNPLQVAERVRVTCDPINTPYALGRGRINALKALTIENLPSVRLESFAVSDSPGGNGNGTAQPAETLNIRCTVKNYLAPTSPGATVQLTNVSPYIVVLQGSFPIGALGTLDSASNASQPFRVYVTPDVPPSHKAVVQLTVQDGSFTDTQTFSFPVNPTYQTHDINAIQLTLTNNGGLGFADYPDNKEGVGFIFHGNNYLFEGGLILGTSSAKLVSVVRNETGSQDADFTSSDFYSFTTPGILSHQDGSTRFTDGVAPFANQLGVRVHMHSYAFSSAADAKYIILRYDIQNMGSDTLKDLRVGIFLDWDVGDPASENFEKNVSGYDPTRSLGYCYDVTRSWLGYVGIRALDSASSFRSLDRDLADLTRAGKWNWISGGLQVTEIGPTDIHQVLSSGPFAIAPGDSQIVGFALVAGDSSLADIQQNADAAKAKWAILRNSGFIPVSVADDRSTVPASFSLSQNYPNPFNPTTSFEFTVPSSEFISIRVFDVLGREVAVLVDEIRKAGVYTVNWHASGLPSGVYFCRMHAGEFVTVTRAILMK